MTESEDKGPHLLRDYWIELEISNQTIAAVDDCKDFIRWWWKYYTTASWRAERLATNHLWATTAPLHLQAAPRPRRIPTSTPLPSAHTVQNIDGIRPLLHLAKQSVRIKLNPNLGRVREPTQTQNPTMCEANHPTEAQFNRKTTTSLLRLGHCHNRGGQSAGQVAEPVRCGRCHEAVGVRVDSRL